MTTADTILLPNTDRRSGPDKELLRAGLLMLLFMTTAFGAETWNAVQGLSSLIKAVPVVLFVVVCILVARLYAKVDELAAVEHTTTCPVEPVLAPRLGVPEHSVKPINITEGEQVPLETRKEIWNYWDKNGTGRGQFEYVKRAYALRANVVQHLLEHYDVNWREQVAMLYCDNPLNEYTAYNGVDENQVAEDALRLKSGLPIYPVAGVWLCCDCRKRPCHCGLVTSNDLDRA